MKCLILILIVNLFSSVYLQMNGEDSDGLINLRPNTRPTTNQTETPQSLEPSTDQMATPGSFDSPSTDQTKTAQESGSPANQTATPQPSEPSRDQVTTPDSFDSISTDQAATTQTSEPSTDQVTTPESSVTTVDQNNEKVSPSNQIQMSTKTDKTKPRPQEKIIVQTADGFTHIDPKSSSGSLLSSSPVILLVCLFLGIFSL